MIKKYSKIITIINFRAIFLGRRQRQLGKFEVLFLRVAQRGKYVRKNFLNRSYDLTKPKKFISV